MQNKKKVYLELSKAEVKALELLKTHFDIKTNTKTIIKAFTEYLFKESIIIEQQEEIHRLKAENMALQNLFDLKKRK